jgi:hypothetical protein
MIKISLHKDLHKHIKKFEKSYERKFKDSKCLTCKLKTDCVYSIYSVYSCKKYVKETI